MSTVGKRRQAQPALTARGGREVLHDTHRGGKISGAFADMDFA
jgi:hypothetical protein